MLSLERHSSRFCSMSSREKWLDPSTSVACRSVSLGPSTRGLLESELSVAATRPR